MKNQSTNSAGACSGTNQMLWHLLKYLLNGKFVICRRSETLSDKEIYLRQLWLFGLFNWTIYSIVLFYCFIVLLYLFVEDLCTTILKYKFEIQINKPDRWRKAEMDRTYIYTHTYMHTYIYIYIYTYTHIHTYINYNILNRISVKYCTYCILVETVIVCNGWKEGIVRK